MTSNIKNAGCFGLMLAGAVECLIFWSLANPVFAQQPEAAKTAPSESPENPFPGRFPAPSLDGGTEWLNVSGPISLRDLRGKIVVLDFWTYCCINCMHVLPDLKFLEQKYKDQVVVIGVHSAKFDNEKETENIRQAIQRYEIEHPVINDSDLVVARKYMFSSWPTLVLIDPEGNFVGSQPGEGNRELFDRVIGEMVAYHRAKGTLDESPVMFHLERNRATPTPLRYPGKLLADAAGNRLFVADSNHNRIVISSLTGELMDVIGAGAIGASDGSYDRATFDHPQGMALVGNVLYVADTENHLIRRVDLTAKSVTTLAGTGKQSRERISGGALRETALNSPWAIQHLDGTLYIAMAGPHQLWKHVLGSDRIEVFAGSGREDILDGPLSTAAIAQPSDVTTDGHELFHVDSEGNAVRRVTLGPKGSVTTLVGPHDLSRGATLFEFGDRDGIGEKVRLQHPIGLAFHGGSLFIADTYNDKIKKVEVTSGKTETWLGTGQRGNGLNPVQLAEPAGVSVAGETLFVADTNNHRILRMNLANRQTQEFVIAGLQPPQPRTAPEEETFVEKTEKKSPMTIANRGSVTVEMKFELPLLYKLNALAPVTYRLTADANQTLLDPTAIGHRLRAQTEGNSARFSLPLTGAAGETTLTVTVSYQFCSDGTGGLCRLGSQRWEIPLTVSAGGAETIQLTAKPGP